jgi:5-aminopentanamidase
LECDFFIEVIQHQLAIHYGFLEKAPDGFYNVAQCIAVDGQTLCLQSKLMLPPRFEGNHFTAGQSCFLFSRKGFNIATLICYDSEFPETFRLVAEMGAHLVLVPTALGVQWVHVATKVIPTRAFENGVYVAYANHAGIEQDMKYLGQSCIIGRNCKELARTGEGEEVLIARLDLENIDSS